MSNDKDNLFNFESGELKSVLFINSNIPGIYDEELYIEFNQAMLDLHNDLNKKNKTLKIVINSYGGCVDSMIRLLSIIEEYQNTVAIVHGVAMSAAFVIMCSCNEIYINPFSTLMFHDMNTMISGKTNEIKSVMSINDRLSHIISDKINLDMILSDEEQILSQTSEVYLLGEDLINRGLAFRLNQLIN